MLTGPGVGGPDRTTEPPVRTKPTPSRIVVSRLPAHRATAASNTFRQPAGTVRTRPGTTSMSRRSSSRTTVFRNEARRCLDSTKSIRASGLTILIGIPGSPAPDPMSTRFPTLAGMTRRNTRLSSSNSSAIHTGSEEPTIRCALFHLISKPRYLLNRSASVLVSSRCRTSGAPRLSRSSATLVASTLGPRCVLRLARRAAGTRPVHEPLLEDLEDVRNCPVQYEPRR